MPIGMITLAQAAGPQRIGRVMSVVGVPMLLGPVLGPVLGGVLVTHLSWRWIFFVNLPIGLVGLVLAARLLPSARAEGRQAGGPERLDWRGLLLLSPGVALVVFGLSEVSTHGSVSFTRLLPVLGRRGPRHRLRAARLAHAGAHRRCAAVRGARLRGGRRHRLPRRRRALRLAPAPAALLPDRARPVAAGRWAAHGAPGAGCGAGHEPRRAPDRPRRRGAGRHRRAARAHARHRRLHAGPPRHALLAARGLALRPRHRPGLHDDAGDGRGVLDARALAGAARDADAQRRPARRRLAGHRGAGRRARAPARPRRERRPRRGGERLRAHLLVGDGLHRHRDGPGARAGTRAALEAGAPRRRRCRRSASAPARAARPRRAPRAAARWSRSSVRPP